jgi:putative pyoverdin transport system ATP-binding/permease protein
VIALIAFLLRTSRRLVALSIATGAFAGACGIALIALIHAELDRRSPSSTKLAVAFGCLCVLAASARVVSRVAMARLGQGAIARLCGALCHKILALPLARFEETDAGGLLAILTDDVSIVAGALTGIPLVAINAPIVICGLLYAGWLSPVILAGGVAFAAVAIFGYLQLAKTGLSRLRQARVSQDRLFGHARSVVEGFRELKLNRERRDALIARDLLPAAETVRDQGLAGMTRFALADGWGQLAYFGFLGFLLFVLPAIRPIDRATLSGAVLVILYLLAPLDVLLMWVPMLGRAQASMLKIEAMLPSLESLGRDEAEPRSLPFEDSLCLDNVTHSYSAAPGERGFSLGPIDLTIRFGEVLFLAGGNGSGKTTLVKLLSGLYEPDGGRVLLDGRTIGDDERESYRQLFSVVFADGYLFARLLGDDPEADERAREGLVRLALLNKAHVKDGEFSTIDLSQGQRRRLALLTALLEDRPILVFDEWAANQDPHFKKFFYLELLPELKSAGKTLIVISHDEDYYDEGDRVVRLHDGEIRQETHSAIPGPCIRAEV